MKYRKLGCSGLMVSEIGNVKASGLEIPQASLDEIESILAEISGFIPTW